MKEQSVGKRHISDSRMTVLTGQVCNRYSEDKQTFIMWIKGAYLESLFAGGGKHFNISAEHIQAKEPQLIFKMRDQISHNMISISKLVLNIYPNANSRTPSENLRKPNLVCQPDQSHMWKILVEITIDFGEYLRKGRKSYHTHQHKF